MASSTYPTAMKTTLPPTFPPPGPGAPTSSTPHRRREKCWLWDDTDNRFPPHRILALVSSFVLYVVDVGLDVWVAVEYYIADREGTDPNARYYLAATLFFIIVPCIIINFISWALYLWGWLIYRNQRLKTYCCNRLEQMRYTKQCSGQPDDVLLVDGVHVINWAKGDQSQQRPGSRYNSVQYSTRTEVINLDTCECPAPTNITSHRRKGSSAPILYDTDLHDTDMDVNTNGVEATDTGLEFYPLDLFDSYEFLAVTLLHVFLLGYLYRAIRLLYTRKRDKYSFDRYRDISFLRLVEAFLESAPQVVLQLYLLVVHQEAVLWYKIVTPISIIFSIVSLALAVGNYISADKDVNHYDPHPSEEKRPRLSWPGYITVILWHLSMIIARGLAFSLFATVYGAYVFLIVVVHYTAMVYWMYWQQAHVFHRDPEDRAMCTPRHMTCRNWIFPCQQRMCANYGIEFVVAAFNVFFHFKIRDGRAIVTLIPFYLLSFVENALMILLWYFGRDMSEEIWYGVPAIVTVFASFFLGLGLLISYYLCCQPSRETSLEPDSTLNHPTLTATLNRMYEVKEMRGNFFRRTLNSCTKKD